MTNRQQKIDFITLESNPYMHSALTGPVNLEAILMALDQHLRSQICRGFFKEFFMLRDDHGDTVLTFKVDETQINWKLGRVLALQDNKLIDQVFNLLGGKQ